ncbi:MAG: hypothetical protein LBE78_04505 [Burkholderiaceae bacterium]|jgi:hypothetical protein|nr:hypothetical protein [Burkholderiaceae bacterium]
MLGSVEPRGQQSLKDIIVTLPGWGLAAIAGLCLFSLALAVGLIGLSNSDNVKGYSVQLLVILVPLGSAVIAGIAIRRTSTQQIDRLVTGFLEQTLLKRFQIHCDYSPVSSARVYPFHAVTLVEPCRGTSYAVYQLDWRTRGNGLPRSPALIGVKCNVFNFELCIFRCARNCAKTFSHRHFSSGILRRMRSSPQGFCTKSGWLAKPVR